MSIESWLIADGMSAMQIKAHLLNQGFSIEQVADRIREPRTQVSATINYLRLNLRIRKKLIATYGIRFSSHIQPAKSQRKPRRAKLQEVANQ